jgi:hypothetical protein
MVQIEMLLLGLYSSCFAVSCLNALYSLIPLLVNVVSNQNLIV